MTGNQVAFLDNYEQTKAQRHAQLMRQVDAQMAELERQLKRRQDRRQQDVPVEFDRRSGIDRRAK